MEKVTGGLAHEKRCPAAVGSNVEGMKHPAAVWSGSTPQRNPEREGTTKSRGAGGREPASSSPEPSPAE